MNANQRELLKTPEDILKPFTARGRRHLKRHLELINSKVDKGQ